MHAWEDAIRNKLKGTPHCGLEMYVNSAWSKHQHNYIISKFMKY